MSRRDVLWALAAVPVALVLGIVAFSTSMPLPIIAAGVVCWIAVLIVWQHRRR